MIKKRLFFPLFFVLIMITSMFFIRDVNSISYYNWLRNSSFEVNTNYIEDPSFESGVFESGIVYGNWSGEFGASISMGNPRTGVYSVYLAITSDIIWYSFVDLILGADVEEFNFYVTDVAGTNAFNVYINYSDSTQDTVAVDDDDVGDWTLIDVISGVNGAKYIEAIGVQRSTTSALFVDDFVFTIYDAGINSQDEIGAFTYPWQNFDYTGIFPWFGINSEMSTDYPHSGEYSYKIVEGSYLPLFQVIDFLDSDYIHYCDMYGHTEDGNNVVISIVVLYSDGSMSYRNQTLEYGVGWQHLNFGKAFINSGKIITGFAINCYENTIGNSSLTYIDDVGFWASAPLGTHRFEYYTTPSPVSKGGWSITLYQDANYQFYGVLYDSDGSNTENGTYKVTSSRGLSKNGDITLGLFNFAITPRHDDSDFSEIFVLQLTTTTEVLTFQIYVNWDYIAGGEDGDGEGGLITVSWLLQFFVLIVPAMSFGFLCSDSERIDPVVGIIVGLLLSSFLFYQAFGNILGVVICVVAIGAIIFTKRSL